MSFVDPIPTIPDVPFRPDLADVLSPGPGQPVALFPVRLETRYFATPPNGFELRVRVYPDTVHLDTHEPELTDHRWSHWRRAAICSDTFCLSGLEDGDSSQALIKAGKGLSNQVR